MEGSKSAKTGANVKVIEKKEKEGAENANDCTLFVRNIGWDTSEEDFRNHME